MRSTFPVIFFLTVVLASALWGGQALAHGTGSEAVSEPVEAVRFFYIGGDPMAYAAIKVFSPTDDKAEYQAGFADGDGHFAFVPNAAGNWRVVASDGMGHRAEAVVSHVVAAGGVDSKIQTAHDPVSDGHLEIPTVWKIVLGLSLILNLGLLAQWATQRSRRSGQREGAAHAHQ
ncbi:MAG: hypothetical protein FWF41_06740 [Betaproteobacteria bacterium]|nr:hypothetical protein [Betaproteobacteria bacterium]